MAPYTPTDWRNLPLTLTPLNATNLNKLTNEIKAQALELAISNALPTWTNNIAPALTDPAGLNEMERVTQLIAQYLGANYTKTTWESGWVPARNSFNFDKLEIQAQTNRAAIDASGPPAGGTLLWTPPGYPSYSGYTTWSPTNSDARKNFTSSTDVRVVMPATPITVDGGININNARNVVIIGGEIFDSFVLTQAQAAAGEAWRQISLYLTGITGTAHIEGMWIHGNGCGDALQSGLGNSNARIRIQNCRFHNNHDVQNSGTTGWDGSHPDTTQCYAGPAYWDMFQNTFISAGNIRTWQPYEFGSNTTAVHMERMNMLAQQKTGSYVLTDDATSWWPEYHADLWLAWGGSGNFHRQIVGSGGGYHTATYACWNPGGAFNVSGENLKIGVRPQGDWVPAPTVGNPTTCGVGYVSPGYV